ncbi:MAG: epoxyqueuosine reductase QueH, partial [Thermodesulfovibrionales bacterium]|nr:epoxyqueuosine reductase QueH [Thermodesulfovibrionales bacterium]
IIYNDIHDNALYKHDNSLYKDAVREITTRGGTRCEACYTVRLRHTAMKAKETGLDAFTTSLLVSPYQKHELVRKAGLEAARIHGVEFYYEDFRPGWDEGRAISRQMGLYRQNYCGCAASKQEREAERAKRRAARRAAGAIG